MCGIVGLFIKDPALEPRLGGMLASMLTVMSDRGPDSAGFAIYGAGESGHLKMTLRSTEHDLSRLAPDLGELVGEPVAVVDRGTHVVVSIPKSCEARVVGWLNANHPGVEVAGSGSRIEIYKEVGLPAAVAEQFDLAGMSGTHGIGHTRMATESAVTTAGAHPFSTGPDQCLVHNGSLSNHSSVRRRLKREGLDFKTQNDSEVAAGYLTWRMSEGASLEEALQSSLAELDGFYTFVAGAEDGFAVLRDPISCKPAVMAETDRYVAFGSEYRALAGLPGIKSARVFEPEPAKVYAWTRN